MQEKIFSTDLGDIHYWINIQDNNMPTLVFLPGLTVDHRLFEKQFEYFEFKSNILGWDAPLHGSSWPFDFNFNLFDMAKWLDAIFVKEKIKHPIIVGQSMGGYVGQVYNELYTDKLKGFIAIDSAPVQKKYFSNLELWFSKRMDFLYLYPSEYLLNEAIRNTSRTRYGKHLMKEMLSIYGLNKGRYLGIATHGYRIIAEAVEENLNCEINCPALLICGSMDNFGYTKIYNWIWNKETKIPLEWIRNAGHNSNTDEPKVVNKLIERFIEEL